MSEEVCQRITGHTDLLGLLAYPIRHSESPRMHNLALSKLGLDYAYLCFEVDGDNLRGAIDGFRMLKVRGWNVSMPNKTDVIQYLDKTDTTVDLIGTCNTVVNDAGVLTGYNTDGSGWVAGLRNYGVEVKGATITVIGAGGASTAMVIQAALDGAEKIHIFNRKDRFYEFGANTVAKINNNTDTTATMGDVGHLDAFRTAVSESSILANATNVGMTPLEGMSPLPDTSVLRHDLFVSDVVYAPLKSKFLEQADAAGCRFMNGLPMMYHQGAMSFKLFTGHDMPLDYVREHMFD